VELRFRQLWCVRCPVVDSQGCLLVHQNGSHSSALALSYTDIATLQLVY